MLKLPTLQLIKINSTPCQLIHVENVMRTVFFDYYLQSPNHVFKDLPKNKSLLILQILENSIHTAVSKKCEIVHKKNAKKNASQFCFTTDFMQDFKLTKFISFTKYAFQHKHIPPCKNELSFTYCSFQNRIFFIKMLKA